jgi:hypothetical protein
MRSTACDDSRKEEEEAAITRGPGSDRNPQDDYRVDRRQSGNVNAVILRLAEDRKEVRHL